MHICPWCSLYSWILSTFSTDHETEIYPNHFLSILGGEGWNFTRELIILIMMCILQADFPVGIFLTWTAPGVIVCNDNDFFLFLLLYWPRCSEWGHKASVPVDSSVPDKTKLLQKCVISHGFITILFFKTCNRVATATQCWVKCTMPRLDFVKWLIKDQM